METQKAKQLIEHTQDIAILPSPEFIADSFPGALALFYSLKKLGKNVNLIAQNYPQKYNFLVKENLRLKKADFLITIKENGAEFSKLSYEKTDEGLDIFISTEKGELRKENIAMSNIREAELLITVGVESFKTVGQLFEAEPKTVINIDNHPENENYGDVNIVETNSLTLSKVVFDLIESLGNDLFDAKISTALLAGIIEETGGLQSAGTSKETFRKVKHLLEKGALLEQIIDNIKNIADKKGLHLLGRSILNSEVDKKRDIVSVMLKQNDFKLTNSQPADLKFMLRKISSGLFPFPHFICLWEQTNSPLEVLGVFYSSNQNVLEKACPHFYHRKKGNGILFRSDIKDIEKTREKLLNILM